MQLERPSLSLKKNLVRSKTNRRAKGKKSTQRCTRVKVKYVLLVVQAKMNLHAILQWFGIQTKFSVRQSCNNRIYRQSVRHLSSLITLNTLWKNICVSHSFYRRKQCKQNKTPYNNRSVYARIHESSIHVSILTMIKSPRVHLFAETFLFTRLDFIVKCRIINRLAIWP